VLWNPEKELKVDEHVARIMNERGVESGEGIERRNR